MTALTLVVAARAAGAAASDRFVKTEHGRFMRSGKPYYYIGANYWQGALLGSRGTGGDRARLRQELDEMRDLGITNLRVLVGADGPNGQFRRVSPTLQTSPGVYNRDMLEGLDYLLAEMAKRGQVAVLYLTNTWDWSGGFSQYLNWNGHGQIPSPSSGHSWTEFTEYTAHFFSCGECQAEYRAHVKFILGRTNALTGTKYVDDPTIMAWEIANEPRPLATANLAVFQNWVRDTAAWIKRNDPHHLVTTGSEGEKGCAESLTVFEQIHSYPEIDYLTIHIWPFNWKWIDVQDLPGTLPKAEENTFAYLERHLAVARKLGKPMILEEFGMPRDAESFARQSPTSARDAYYRGIFSRVLLSARKGTLFAGCNFWAYGGAGRPAHTFSEAGDDAVGDPPHEEQGLNCVFDTDTTNTIIHEFARQLGGANP